MEKKIRLDKFLVEMKRGSRRQIKETAKKGGIFVNGEAGVVSATEDKLHRTVIDLLGEETRRDLFPVGRLDIDTEGLLILTNDGELAHRLLSPKKHVDKQYYAEIYGRLPTDSAARMESGMVLEDGTQLQPGKLEILASGSDGNLRQESGNGYRGYFNDSGREVSSGETDVCSPGRPGDFFKEAFYGQS